MSRREDSNMKRGAGQAVEAEPAKADEVDNKKNPAYEFGWQSYLQYGRPGATSGARFEDVEPRLAEAWNTRPPEQRNMPWEAARALARDAWNQVQNAMIDGTQPKTSAR